MKVGLDYGNSAVETASLSTISAAGLNSGLRFNRMFTSWSTSQTALTMIKDVNVRLMVIGTVGCFHIMLNSHTLL
jgi:hypothetical protein